MSTAVATNGKQAQVSGAEQVLIQGDLSKLSADDRVSYYKAVCESVGLNPLTKPFEYITLNGKLTLYAKRDCTDQLRSLRRVSITIVERTRQDDVYVVVARATTPDGRTDESSGAVPLGTMKGEALANALMKAETKAKRRVTLSICGLGFLDESELDTIPDARPVPVEQPQPAKPTPADAAQTLKDAGLPVQFGNEIKAPKQPTGREQTQAIIEQASQPVEPPAPGEITFVPPELAKEIEDRLQGHWCSAQAFLDYFEATPESLPANRGTEAVQKLALIGDIEELAAEKGVTLDEVLAKAPGKPKSLFAVKVKDLGRIRGGLQAAPARPIPVG